MSTFEEGLAFWCLTLAHWCFFGLTQQVLSSHYLKLSFLQKVLSYHLSPF